MRLIAFVLPWWDQIPGDREASESSLDPLPCQLDPDALDVASRWRRPGEPPAPSRAARSRRATARRRQLVAIGVVGGRPLGAARSRRRRSSWCRCSCSGRATGSVTRMPPRSGRSSRSASRGIAHVRDRRRSPASARRSALAAGSIFGARLGPGLLARLDERVLKIGLRHASSSPSRVLMVGARDDRGDASTSPSLRFGVARRRRLGSPRRRWRHAAGAVPDARRRPVTARGGGDVAARDPADRDRRHPRPAPARRRQRSGSRFASASSASVGAVLGALLALALPAATLRIVFAGFVAVVGVKLVRDGLRPGARLS